MTYPAQIPSHIPSRGAFRVFSIALLLSLSACAFIESEGGGPIGTMTGTIEREGHDTRFVGYDPVPTSQTFGGFGAAAYIEEGEILAFVSLEFVAIQGFLSDRPAQVPVQDVFLREEYGVGLSFFEQSAGAESSNSATKIYRHAYLEGHGGTTTGTLYIDDTDWDTYLNGRLEASLDNPMFGQREIKLDVSWIGPRE